MALSLSCAAPRAAAPAGWGTLSRRACALSCRPRVAARMGRPPRAGPEVTAEPAPAVTNLTDLACRLKAAKAEVKALKAALKREKKQQARAESSSSSSSSSSGSDDDDGGMHARAGGADEATTAVLKVSVSELVADAAARQRQRRAKDKAGKQAGKQQQHSPATTDSSAARRAATTPAALAEAAATLGPHPRRAAAVGAATAAPPPPGGSALAADSPLVIHTPTGPALAVSAAATAAASPSSPASTTVLKVCTGAACRRLGSATLLARLRAEHDGPVRACSCLGRCGRSRAEAASDGEAEAVSSWWEEQADEAGDEVTEPFLAAGPGGAVVPTGFV
jgi:hypothetical protein